MKAAIIKEFNGIEGINIQDVPCTVPKENEILIEVAYAGLNPVDYKIAEGRLASRMPYELPIILGWDVAGKIVSCGSSVEDFKKGDRVFAYCRKNQIHEGSCAEFIVIEARNAALMPSNLSFAEAAAVPLAALTAWQALFEKAAIKKGETVLIHAGAGGVGGFAVQFAKIEGAEVITTASSVNHPYVEKLGATFVIDYMKENVQQRLLEKFTEGVDVVFDTVGGKTLEQSYSLLKKGGRLVTLLGPIDEALAQTKGIQAMYLFASPSGKQLAHFAKLFEKGKLQAPLIQQFPFEDISFALKHLQQGHTRGKLVLAINSQL